MTVRDILLLGNPKLYGVSERVTRDEIGDALVDLVSDLHDTLVDFREKYGAGRAIASPQVGVMKRIIYMCIETPIVFVNPVLSDKSAEMIELWDD